jgi:hypothetical protein
VEVINEKADDQPWLRLLVAGPLRGGLLSIPVHVTSVLMQWHWDSFFSEYFGFPVSLSWADMAQSV